MTISTGQRLPSAPLAKVTDHGPEQVMTDDFFRGRKVALFAVPGAFTPTCSAKHLPGFIGKIAELRAAGIDEVACTAVNDVFVLAAWGRAHEIGTDVTMLADGNGEFAKAIGLEVDSSHYGMGTRSQRYVMLVNDGVVEQLHVEAPGEFRVSSAEHLLESMRG